MFHESGFHQAHTGNSSRSLGTTRTSQSTPGDLGLNGGYIGVILIRLYRDCLKGLLGDMYGTANVGNVGWLDWHSWSHAAFEVQT